jgi:hypothetical protein
MRRTVSTQITLNPLNCYPSSRGAGVLVQGRVLARYVQTRARERAHAQPVRVPPCPLNGAAGPWRGTRRSAGRTGVLGGPLQSGQSHWQ